MKYLICFVLCLLMPACTNEGIVVQKAQLFDITLEDSRELTASELSELNNLLGDGLVWVIGQKWQVGNHIIAESNKGEINIFMYDSRYLKLSTSGSYYRVKPDYLDFFHSLNRNAQ